MTAAQQSSTDSGRSALSNALIVASGIDAENKFRYLYIYAANKEACAATGEAYTATGEAAEIESYLRKSLPNTIIQTCAEGKNTTRIYVHANAPFNLPDFCKKHGVDIAKVQKLDVKNQQQSWLNFVSGPLENFHSRIFKGKNYTAGKGM